MAGLQEHSCSSVALVLSVAQVPVPYIMKQCLCTAYLWSGSLPDYALAEDAASPGSCKPGMGCSERHAQPHPHATTPPSVTRLRHPAAEAPAVARQLQMRQTPLPRWQPGSVLAQSRCWLTCKQHLPSPPCWAAGQQAADPGHTEGAPAAKQVQLRFPAAEVCVHLKSGTISYCVCRCVQHFLMWGQVANSCRTWFRGWAPEVMVVIGQAHQTLQTNSVLSTQSNT